MQDDFMLCDTDGFMHVVSSTWLVGTATKPDVNWQVLTFLPHQSTSTMYTEVHI